MQNHKTYLRFFMEIGHIFSNQPLYKGWFNLTQFSYTCRKYPTWSLYLQSRVFQKMGSDKSLTLTTLSSFLRIAATTRPPTLENSRPETRNIWTLILVSDTCWTTSTGTMLGRHIRWTAVATIHPYRYNQNCCLRKFSPEF